MCGIAGIWNLPRGANRARVSAMLTAMAHRGPDGQGLHEHIGGCFGMVRLALVDLSPRGQQPIWSSDGRVAIIFNGEAYNFREERSALEARGHRFRSNTDTEVALCLYLEFGLEFVHRLRGMFALAILDFRNSGVHKPAELLLARDPIGIKPLYVGKSDESPDCVVFASELRGILASGLISRELDSQSVFDYFAVGFVPQPNTIVSNVRMVSPGTVERFVVGKPSERRRFWQFPRACPRHESLDDAAARLRVVLDDTVALHATADAKVGAFLSGGIDSAGVVGLMRKHVANIETYTIRFPDLPGGDAESQEAVATATQYECRSNIVDVSSSDIAALLPRFAGELDQPSTDGLNTWLISRAAARDVKAVLSGIGGDEYFAGYSVVRRMLANTSGLRGTSKQVAAWLAELFSKPLPDSVLRTRLENIASRRTPFCTWYQAHQVFPARTVGQLLGYSRQAGGIDDLLSNYLTDLDGEVWQDDTTIGLASQLDTRMYMQNQLLRDCDATSMAHSLELRVPLVDVQVLEFSRSCLDSHKLKATHDSAATYRFTGAKQVLIHALRDVLPAGIADRPKRGFSLPYATWMRNSLQPLIQDACGAESIQRRGIVDRKVIERVRLNYAGHQGSQYPQLWSLLIFELWCRSVLDTPIPGNWNEHIQN